MDNSVVLEKTYSVSDFYKHDCAEHSAAGSERQNMLCVLLI